MKKLFFIAFALMLSFSTAFAGGDNHRPELARDTEPDTGDGNGTVYNLFISKCGKIYTYPSSRMLTSKEFNYLQGWYDAQCTKQQWQTV